MKIYTRGGDQGETSLFGGERVTKDTPRVEAYGSVDELNALLGLAASELEGQADLRGYLGTIQRSLFDLGAELATPESDASAGRKKAVPQVNERDVTELESWIDKLDAELEPLRSFVLPGGARAAGLLHLARTVCRRSERRVVALGHTETVVPVWLHYLNRLSDLLFVMARVVNHRAGVEEPTWVGRGRK